MVPSEDQVGPEQRANAAPTLTTRHTGGALMADEDPTAAQRPKRKGLSRRTRFEIFKRDGFVCKYCGRSPAAAPLHVDHVVPVIDGGSSGPENLVTACDDCNLGKSAVSLDDIRLQAVVVSRDSLEKQKEHAEQIAAFLAHEKVLQAERDKVHDMLAQHWEACIGPMSQEMFDRLAHLMRTDSIPALMEAMRITGERHGTPLGIEYEYGRAVKQQRYFSAVMRNYREHGQFGVWS